jgi:hypothetical protein
MTFAMALPFRFAVAEMQPGAPDSSASMSGSSDPG